MILLETATTTTIDTPATVTCAQCPFARLIEDNRYCCQVSQTASDVKRGHWEATVSCFEALASAKAEAEKVAEVAEAPIAQTPARAPSKPATASQTVATAAIIPAPIAIIEENDAPPNRGGNDRNNAQLAIIREELTAIGIKLGKLISSRKDIKGWFVVWEGSPAALYWSSGNGWEISTRKGQSKLTGNWEGFDLIEHLDSNGIELPE